MTDNPLADFVELPEEYRPLCYSNMLAGVIRGALEMVRTQARRADRQPKAGAQTGRQPGMLTRWCPPGMRTQPRPTPLLDKGAVTVHP